MNKFNLLGCLTALLLTIGSCKKDSPNNNNNNSNTSPLGANSPSLPSGAAGALYAVLVNSSIGPTSTCYGWFGSYTSTQNAGVVLCDGDTLATAIPFTNESYPWYELSVAAVINGGNIPDFTQGNNVQWSASGGSSVPAINYNDTATWTQVINFNPPSTVSISTPLTITFGITGPYKEIICSIQGSKSTVSQTSSATSSTFTASQLASAATNNDNLTIEVMPVGYTPQSIGGKTYYFVKQNAFAAGATTTP